LADRLGLEPSRWTLAYQSRFGREPWLRPYTDETLASWGQQRIERVDVVCPGFAADCLETLEEIAITGRRGFEAAGGGRFRYIPALNDREDHIDAIADIAVVNLTGWVKTVD
jgi:ferrochelatase